MEFQHKNVVKNMPNLSNDLQDSESNSILLPYWLITKTYWLSDFLNLKLHFMECKHGWSIIVSGIKKFQLYKFLIRKQSHPFVFCQIQWNYFYFAASKTSAKIFEYLTDHISVLSYEQHNTRIQKWLRGPVSFEKFYFF